jgi:hypothetical protein
MSNSEKPLFIDIPVKLPELKVAFSVAALAFEGDLPASLFHLTSSRKTPPTGTPIPKSSRSFTRMQAT